MNETWAVMGAFIILVLALMTMWFSIRITKIENSAVLIGLMIIPVVTYLILSGRLGEFKGPGGLEAKVASDGGKTVSIRHRRRWERKNSGYRQAGGCHRANHA